MLFGYATAIDYLTGLKTNDMRLFITALACLISVSVFGQTAKDYFDKARNNESDWQYQIDNYTKCLLIDPDAADAYFYRGIASNELGRYEDAIADFTKAISIDPDDVLAYNNRGLSYSKLGNEFAAIVEFMSAIKIDPDNANLYYNIGVSYMELENHEYAITEFTKAIIIDPDYASAYNNRGISKYLSGFEGCSDLMEAIKIGGVECVHPDALKTICE